MTNLEHHVVSLELAKQLKEAGYPQDRVGFWWTRWSDKWELTMVPNDDDFVAITGGSIERRKAPLASELMIQLPKRFFNPNFKETHLDFLHVGPELKSGWLVVYDNHNFIEERTETWDESLPNALAKMWLLLKEIKIV